MPTKTKKPTQDVLTLDDQAKIAELTGGSAESITEASASGKQNKMRSANLGMRIKPCLFSISESMK